MQTTIIAALKYFGFALIGFFAPVTYAFIFIGILVAIDTITGIMKAGKDDVRNITSKKGFSLVPKLIFYFLLVIVAHCCACWVDPQVPFVKLVLIGIGWIEIKSIDENYKVLAGHSFIDKIMEGMKSINQIKRHKDDA
jgi:phage-related holin